MDAHSEIKTPMIEYPIPAQIILYPFQYSFGPFEKKLNYKYFICRNKNYAQLPRFIFFDMNIYSY